MKTRTYLNPLSSIIKKPLMKRQGSSRRWATKRSPTARLGTYAADVSVSLAAVGVGRGIILVGGWLGITLVLQHADVGVTSVGVVGVPFDAEVMGGVA